MNPCFLACCGRRIMGFRGWGGACIGCISLYYIAQYCCVPPLRATVRLRLDIAMQIRRAHVHRRPLAYTAARSPTAARRGVTLQAKQHLPYVPGGPQKIYILLPFLGSCSPRSPCATTSRNCASDIAMQVRRVQAHHATPTHCNCCNGCAW